jgi:hypothetical protein
VRNLFGVAHRLILLIQPIESFANQNLSNLSNRPGGMLDYCAVSSQIHLQHNPVLIEAAANSNEIGGCGFG